MYNSQNHNEFSLKWHEIVHFTCNFEYFYTFVFFGIITLGPARSQKIFLDKQSETCQKSSSSRKSTDLRRKVDFSKSKEFSMKLHIYTYLCMIFRAFSFFVFFCIITLGSARSQKKFLDKQSETCQKSSSSRKSTDLRRKVDFSNSTNLLWKWHDFIQFRYNSHVFPDFYIFLYYDIGLCEISEKFS